MKVGSRDARWLWMAVVVACLGGAIVVVVWSADPLLRGVAVLLGVCAGVLYLRAEKRGLQSTLSEREALIRVIFDGAIDAIVTVDSRGLVVSFNSVAEGMFGWRSQEIIGRSVDLLFAKGSEGETNDGDHEVTSSRWEGTADGREATARRKDGSRFPMLVKYNEAQRHGGGLVTVIARDVTEYRRNAEALEAANAMLETKILELEERTRLIAILGRMSDFLQGAVSPAEAHLSISKYARRLFPRDAGALCAVDSSQNVFELVASWGEPPIGRPSFAPSDCWARHGGSHIESGKDDEDACTHVSFIATARDAFLPIVSQGELLWTVCFRWWSGDEGTVGAAVATEPFRTELAVAFAEQVGLALSNLRLKEMLRAEAIHDPLTGLHNRRFLEESFHRELLRAARKKSPVGVLMLDLDHFKAFNDSNGHAAGDALLRAVGAQLRRDIRAEDIACRYGGEEFAVILPDATLDQALTRAEQIREGLQGMIVEFQGKQMAGVTVSIGVAALPEHGSSSDALLRAADAALYTAKVEGRNQTKPAESSFIESSKPQPNERRTFESSGARG